MEVWVRKCASFAEERQADREFWASMTPEARVAALDEMRSQWPAPDIDELQQGLRRTVRVIQREGR